MSYERRDGGGYGGRGGYGGSYGRRQYNNSGPKPVEVGKE